MAPLHQTCRQAEGPREALCEVGIGVRHPSLGDHNAPLATRYELPHLLGNWQISSRGVSKTW